MANTKGSARPRTYAPRPPAPKGSRTCKRCLSVKPVEGNFSTTYNVCFACKLLRAEQAIANAKAILCWENLTPKQKARRKAAMKRYQKKLRAARSRAKRPKIARMRGPTRLALLGDSGDNNN